LRPRDRSYFAETARETSRHILFLIADRIDCCRRIRPRFPRQMSSWLSAAILAPLAAQTLSLPTQQQAQAPMGIGPSRVTAASTASSTAASNLFCAAADVTTCSAFVVPRVRLPSPRRAITTTTSTTSTSNSNNSSNSSSNNRLQFGGGMFGSREC
ncbi:unnamed protein product, partial [Laminaria digitata]